MPNEDNAKHVNANMAAAKAHMAVLLARYEQERQANAYVSGQSSSHEEDDSGSSTSQDDKHEFTSAEDQSDDDTSQLEDGEVPDLVNSGDENSQNGGTDARRFNYQWIPVQGGTYETMQEVNEICVSSTPEEWPSKGVTDYQERATQEIVDAMMLYQQGRQEGTLRYSKADITTVLGLDDKAPEGVERVIVGNVMLAHPQCQVMTNWNYGDPTEVFTKKAEQYLTQYKMAFDPAIINISVLMGIERIYGNTTFTPQ